MKKKLLFILFALVALNMSAQVETITVDWSFNSTPTAVGNANSDRTVEVGDTVEWNWYANGSHNVVSTGGDESFNSGATTSNPGVNFSFEFLNIGSTTYVCQPHAGNMFGTITVVAEGVLSVQTFEALLLQTNVYPNPASTELHVDFPDSIDEATIEVYDILGKRILIKTANNLSNTLNIRNWNNGVYLLKISTNDGKSLTKRFVKI